jgi:tetratricopeptide (TPR) repeat protein
MDSLQEAIDNYKAILELNPQNARAHCQIADIYSQMGNKEEAYKLRASAARIFIEKGELEKGIEICEELMKEKPSDAEVRSILNKASLQRDSFKAIESAIEFIEKRQTES